MAYGFALLRIKPFEEIHEREPFNFSMPPRARLRLVPGTAGTRDVEVGQPNECEGPGSPSFARMHKAEPYATLRIRPARSGTRGKTCVK